MARVNCGSFEQRVGTMEEVSAGEFLPLRFDTVAVLAEYIVPYRD